MKAKTASVRRGWLFTFGIVGSVACAPAAPSPVAPASSAPAPPSASASIPTVPEETLASLRTGGLPPIEHPGPARATAVARFADERYETLALEIVLPLSGAFDWSERVGARVSLTQEEAAPYAFAALPDDVSAVEGHGLGAATIWVRRARQLEGKPIQGVIHTPQLSGEPGHKVSFSAQPEAKTKGDPKVLARWASAFATHLREIGSGPWNQFAAARVDEAWGTAKKKPREMPARVSRNDGDLSRLMETTTGLLSVQEALQHDRPLLLAASKEKRTVPLAKLSPPKSASHPWEDLLRTVAAPPFEPLAAAVPAEFWYLRASDLSSLLDLADELDNWGTPAASLMDRSLEERDLAPRYETQLGILRTGLAKALGREIVESVAVAGSDPYLREGSDLTAVFKLRQPALFDAALEAMLATHARAHGNPPTTTVTHGSARISVTASQDGALRQHRAIVGGLAVVSNSLAATQRVLDAIDGKRARLADEKDFRYMLGRDASKQGVPVLFFFGDRFVAEVTGPRQKILEARRQMAAAELMTPGFAALLHGWIHGKSPASVEELVASKLLRKEELKHAGGAPIEWSPGKGARSSWGTPSALTPLIELPAPDTVTESERAAYDHFARTYQTYWSRYVDPTALRLAVKPDPSVAMRAELRVLPLIDGTDYRELLEMAGDARVTASPLEAGLRAVVGIGATARVRQELAGLATGALGRHAVKLDFLGDWAMAGVADRTRLPSIAQKLRIELPQAPESETRRVDEIVEASRIPAYAAVEIRSASGAALALAAVRKMADETLRGMLTWKEAGTERGTTIFRVAVGKPRESPSEEADENRSDLEIFYALTDKAFVVSLDEGVLRGLVGDLAGGRGPIARTGQPKEDASQVVFDLSTRCGGGLGTVLGWLLAEQVVRSSAPGRALAETLLRGAPELVRATDRGALRALSLAYFGAVPTPPHGGSYTLGPEGVRDPVLGTASSPRWPALPVPGSMIDRLLAAIGSFRSEIAFDAEGGPARTNRGMRSLHVGATFGFCRR